MPSNNQQAKTIRISAHLTPLALALLRQWPADSISRALNEIILECCILQQKGEKK